MGTNAKKKTKKKWIVITAISAGALLAVFLLPQVFFRFGGEEASLSTRTVTVERGTIETTVVGSGNLSSENVLDIKLPSSVTVESVLVDAGDTVSEGDVLATLNAASLQSAISEVQDTLSALDAELEDAENGTGSYSVEASVSGRVKQIYATEEADVSEVINESGALALLSLDGKMKVVFTPSSTDRIAVGMEADVALSDGSTVTGTVVSLSSDSCTVTLTDDGPSYGDSVSVSIDDISVGSGTLEINAPISIFSSSAVRPPISILCLRRI